MSPERHRIAVGMGGNIGAVRRTFHQALAWLAERGLQEIRAAGMYLTHPVGCHPGTPDFCNSAFIASWTGTPLALLQLLQGAERQFGRPAQHDSRGNRSLDLDLLLFDVVQICQTELVVPHPRLRERLFVLEPLSEIASDWPIPPDMVSVAECLAVRKRVEIALETSPEGTVESKKSQTKK